jgi:hypothetical protein
MRADIIYVPVQMFIRFSKKDGESGERALLVARRDDGREYIFAYDNDKYGIDGQADLTVCDFEVKQ